MIIPLLKIKRDINKELVYLGFNDVKNESWVDNDRIFRWFMNSIFLFLFLIIVFIIVGAIFGSEDCKCGDKKQESYKHF